MKFHCPTCAVPLLPENINLHTDLALCKGCGNLARPSELADDDFTPVTLTRPPKGAWYRQTMSETVIGATTRNPGAFFLIPFTFVWAGGSMTGIYGSQIQSGEFSLVMSLFGLPFLVGSIVLIATTLMSVCGKVEVRLRDRQGVIFVGVGGLGWKRRIHLDHIDTITEHGWSGANYPGHQGSGILLQGRSRLRFATNLNEPRRHFMLNALKTLKAGRG